VAVLVERPEFAPLVELEAINTRLAVEDFLSAVAS